MKELISSHPTALWEQLTWIDQIHYVKNTLFLIEIGKHRPEMVQSYISAKINCQKAEDHQAIWNEMLAEASRLADSGKMPSEDARRETAEAFLEHDEVHNDKLRLVVERMRQYQLNIHLNS